VKKKERKKERKKKTKKTNEVGNTTFLQAKGKLYGYQKSQRVTVRISGKGTLEARERLGV